jgi:ADP-ribose pyrophosphatase YjhB (NUDIX family)
VAGKLPFRESYLGKLREKVGNDLILTPGARVILEDAEGCIALVKRTDNGLWALPAGSAEPGLSIEDNARREVREETGLILKSFTCYGFASHPEREVHTYPNGNQVHAFAILLCSKDYEGTVGNFDDEVSEVKFYSLDALPPPEDCSPNEYHSIQCYREYRKTGQFQWS